MRPRSRRPLSLAAAVAAAALGQGFEAEALPFLRQHCFRCHGEQRQKGGLRLDVLSSDLTSGDSVDLWAEVVEKLRAGEMPPPDARARPATEESARVAAWLAQEIEAGRAARLAVREAVSFHRLSREEYAHTVFDLLGVPFDAADMAGLIEDDAWRGFERIGAVLSMSPSHVERYLRAAEAILDEAYPEPPPEAAAVRRSAVELIGGPEVPGRERSGALVAAGRADEVRVDLWPGQLVRAAPPGPWTEWAGTYRIRIQLSGLRSSEGRAPHLAVRAETLDRLLFERDVAAPEEEPLVVEFEAHLPVGAHQFSVENAVPGPRILQRLGPSDRRPFFSLAEGRIPWQVQLLGSDGEPVHPLLVVDRVEWEGPLPVGVPHRREAYMPRSADAGEVRARLARFATAAFRRPVELAEVEPYALLVERELAAGATLRAAAKAGLAAILCSSDFLYLVEGEPVEAGAPERRELDDWELAARLSYFLWSTAPDDELRALARAGRLRAPEVLRSQVGRLLRDPRSRRFAESFARQWLQLERVGRFQPDVELYPDYDGHLERSMVRETTAFFGEMLSRDLDLGQLLVSDWTMLNERLALHYGVAGVEGDGFRRVALDPGNHRGGILTQASVLSLTSDGTRHRPVHRGAWLSEVVLGERPPPPPPGVEPIEPNPAGGEKLGVRQQLEAHRAAARCADCHRKLDPYGLAFDNYDAIGRWRTEESVPTGVGADPRVDASGVLPDGRAFGGPAELLQLLVDDTDRFAAAFVEQLATFALRRAMGPDDRGELRRIAARAAEDGYRLRRLVETLVLSDLFTHR